MARTGTRAPLRGRRSLRWVLGGFVVAVFVLLALASYRVAGVVDDLREARQLVDDASAAILDGRVADARASLGRAEQILVAANDALHTSPELDVIALVPVLRQNIDAVRDTVGTSLQLVSGGDRLLRVASPLQGADGRLEVPLRGGSIPLDAVAAAAQQAAALAAALPGGDDRPATALLVGPVREAQDEVFDEAVSRRDQLATLAQGLSLIGDMSGVNGPRRYLVAVANTAEMRGTGGMYLSYGVLESADGDMDLAAFGNIDEILLTDGVDPVAASIATSELERWPGLEPNRLWRNVNLVPDISAIGPRIQDMYQAATGQAIDGVIQVDAEGLAAVLEGIGPVVVDGVGTVDAQNAVDLTLNLAYTLFPDRDQRQEVLGDVAEVAFERLLDGEYDSLRPLAEAMSRAAAERHIIVWTPHAAASSSLEFFGAGGALPDPDVGDSFFLSVQNFGRDKLDYYVDTAVAISGDRPLASEAVLQVEISVSNTAPPGETEPAYVFGDPDFRDDPGTYRGVGSLYVPTGARVEAVHDGGGAPVLIREGERTVAGFDVVVPPGETQTVRFALVLPARPSGPYSVRLVPLPRVRPTVWNLDVRTGPGGSVARSGPLEVPELLQPGD